MLHRLITSFTGSPGLALSRSAVRRIFRPLTASPPGSWMARLRRMFRARAVNSGLRLPARAFFSGSSACPSRASSSFVARSRVPKSLASRSSMSRAISFAVAFLASPCGPCARTSRNAAPTKPTPNRQATLILSIAYPNVRTESPGRRDSRAGTPVKRRDRAGEGLPRTPAGSLFANAHQDRRAGVADLHDEVDRHVGQHADGHVLDRGGVRRRLQGDVALAAAAQERLALARHQRHARRQRVG